MAEDERARRDDEEAEEAEAVGEAAAEHRSGDEVKEREDDDLLIVGRPAPRRDPDDLEHRRELDRDVERRLADGQADPFDEEEGEGADGRDVAQERLRLPFLGDGERQGESDEEDDVRLGGHLCGAHDGEDAERREQIGHHAVDEAEPHDAASARGDFGGALGAGGVGAGDGGWTRDTLAATASTRAR